ncbi:MAG: hypothetical protein ACW99J_20950 [Candidatus Thorarchaeota archaeon]|jgi:hypothetical protein
MQSGMGGIYGIPYTHLSLEEYAEFLQVPEPFLFGIRNHPDLTEGKGCGDYWQQSERHYLATIRREYNEMENRARELPYKWPLYLGKYVRGIGVETESTIASGATVNLSNGTINDPVTISQAVTFTDELIVYYPGQTKYRIRPSEVSISGGTATITIPRSRLLHPDYLKDYNDDTDRPDYTDDSYFLTTVDLVRNYLDTTTGANLVWHRRATDALSCCVVDVYCDPSDPCGETLQLACGYVRDERNGAVQLEPAIYSGGWSKSAYAVKRRPDYTQINYMRGYWDRYEPMDEDIVRAVIAITHNNMPTDPCFRCAVTQHYYERDVTPLEPPVNLGLGPSTWGIYESVQILREFDNRYNGHHGWASWRNALGATYASQSHRCVPK